MSLSVPEINEDKYDEICRMIGDVSIRTQAFGNEVCIYAKRNGYDSNNKQYTEYKRIFGDDNQIIKDLADRRRAFIHEIVPVVNNIFAEDYLNKDYLEIKKSYCEFVKFYNENCTPLLEVIDEGWYKKSQEEINELEAVKERAWIESMWIDK